MKFWVLILLMVTSLNLQAFIRITGRITSDVNCKSDDLFAVFLENLKYKNQYMYQLSAPENGTFEFIVLPGKYSIEAVSKEGCTYIFDKIFVKETSGEIIHNVKLRRNR